MRVRLTEIRTRPTGKKVRVSHDVEVESLFIGRGPDNDLSLKGLTISLHQATIRMSEGRAYIEAAPGQSVNVNGLVSTGERLGIGDKIRIGPWEVRVLEPDTNIDIALEYEEIDRADNERVALDARTKIGLEGRLLARRPLSWAGIAVVLVGFLFVPLVWGSGQSPWTTGAVSHGHAYIENDCQQCHSGFFQGVQNDACMTCHYDTRRHARADSEVAAIDDSTCADCHLEHRGREASLADRGSIACAECHATISSVVADTELRNASDFGTNHPPFKLAVVTDPEADPVSIEISPDVEEDSGLSFNHFLHVGNAVTDLDDDELFLNCGDCHQPDLSGRLMKPIVFEEHCQDCHALRFDPERPQAFAPHEDGGKIRSYVREFYWTRILSGQIDDPSAPRPLRLRPPGASLTETESAIARRWVDGKLADADNSFYGRNGACRNCHDIEAGAANDGGMGVGPVQIQTNWTPGALFSHEKHTPFTCARCHAAAAVLDPEADLPRPDGSLEGAIPYELILAEPDTPVSEESSDILIPEIDVCRECHAGGNASDRGIVASPCSTCHPFHHHELGTMQ